MLSVVDAASRADAAEGGQAGVGARLGVGEGIHRGDEWVRQAGSPGAPLQERLICVRSDVQRAADHLMLDWMPSSITSEGGVRSAVYADLAWVGTCNGMEWNG